jgi:type I restriction enzyme, R subunit
MYKSNFQHISDEYPKLAKFGELAEHNTFIDPSTSLSKLRLLVEKLTGFIIEFEQLDELKDLTQNDRLRKLDYQGVIPSDVLGLFHKIRMSGNKATHTGEGSASEAKFMLKQTLKIIKWFYSVYENEELEYAFVEPVLHSDDTDKLKELETELDQAREEVKNFQDKLAKLTDLSKEQKEERKQQASVKLSKLEENETETRERIDLQLREAGWECDTETINYKTKKTLPERGRMMAIAEWKCGSLWADYALFIGKELYGIVEAKKHIKNISSDLNQAKNYSMAVDGIHDITFPNHGNSSKYRVPFMFATNGKKYLEQRKTASGIWFWDGRKQTNIDRPLPNWFSPQDLKEKLIFDEDNGEKELTAAGNDYLKDPSGLGLRPYQIEAIEAVEQKIISDHEDRRALLAMATGTGKTRTMIGMCYRLIKAKRFRRILFLVDRTMLGDQAADAFKEVKVENLKTFGKIYDIQDLDSKAPELDTKIHFATVQSMVQRIVYSDHPPSVGDYDCIVVDEAHRGYILDKEMEEEELILHDQRDFQSKYRMVLDHFDAYRIGLTATPAVHTAEIFGNPVFNYSYRRAVVEGYLIDFEPPIVFQTKLSKEGIVWEKGDGVQIYDPEDNEIKEAGIAEDEIKVEIQGFNRRVINDNFNRVILNKIITDYGLDPEDRKKTLIFAATKDHGDDIVRILKEEFEELGQPVDNDAIALIVGDTHKRENLLKRYKNEQYPSIVVTVDLLTTGIDVPPICNLIFMRRVNSRILYDQMIGRATRKCDEIGKEVFKIYDAVGVTDLMSKEDVMKPVAPLVTKKFVDLNEEIKILEDEYLIQTKIDRIIAKMQRKVRSLNQNQLEQFETLSGEKTATDFGLRIKSLDTNAARDFITENQSLWDFLDREKGRKVGYGMLYSDHADEVEDVFHAFDKNLKPKDYIESFVNYVKSNMNQVEALKIVCTKPNSLTRKDLKSLRLLLDEEGYNKTKLNTAYKDTTNQQIVADIIAHIRTAALGVTLISHEQRITNAVQKLREKHQFNAIQEKWLSKIEAQLMAENIVTLADFEKPPFSKDGGLKRWNKIFNNETTAIINELNEYLYMQA